jgi:uncharacterized protein (TIGR02588 family)
MAQRKPPAKTTPAKTPVLERTAAALGLAATLAVLGYSVWEGLAGGGESPVLSVESRPAVRTPAGYAAPIVVRNASHATAADVQVRASLEAGGRVVEERVATFAYVPGKGEATGGVIFRTDPATAQLRLEAEGWQDP